MTAPTEDLIARLERTHAAVQCGPGAAYFGKASLSLVNPDGPAAAQALRALQAEVELLEEVCARYADDEDAFLGDEGEPFGSITTECGLKARSARKRFRARSALTGSGE